MRKRENEKERSQNVCGHKLLLIFSTLVHFRVVDGFSLLSLLTHSFSLSLLTHSFSLSHFFSLSSILYLLKKVTDSILDLIHVLTTSHHLHQPRKPSNFFSLSLSSSLVSSSLSLSSSLVSSSSLSQSNNILSKLIH